MSQPIKIYNRFDVNPVTFEATSANSTSPHFDENFGNMAIGDLVFSHETGEDLVVSSDAVVGFEVTISLVYGSF